MKWENIWERIELQMTCGACPEQYDAFLDGKQVGYLRLRHGHFRVDYPDCGQETIYNAYPNGDGCFDGNEQEYFLKEAKMAIAKRICRDESPIKEDGEDELCAICGGKTVLIRGKYPNTMKRSVCPTCTMERLEQIQEISSPNYGRVAKENKIANGKTPNQ